MKIFLKQKNKNEKGFTLIETLVALAIFIVAIVGIMSVLASGLTDINVAKKKMAATFLAQEGIECARNVRDNYVLFGNNTWASFVALGNINTCPAVPTGFFRTTTVAEVSGNENVEAIVTSRVDWGTKSITLNENLFNWYE